MTDHVDPSEENDHRTQNREANEVFEELDEILESDLRDDLDETPGGPGDSGKKKPAAQRKSMNNK
jgi:hypothetical protein